MLRDFLPGSFFHNKKKVKKKDIRLDALFYLLFL